MKDSKIEWTDHTWNGWIGCTKVSPGCEHCYAETLMDKRWGKVKWGQGQARKRTSAKNWGDPLRWNHYRFQCPDCGHWNHSSSDICQADNCKTNCKADRFKLARPRVFCASLSDWLDDEVPIEWLADLLTLIRRTPNLDWLLLSKRPENWKARLQLAMDAADFGSAETRYWVANWRDGKPPANVWIGTTVEDQRRADERIPQLLEIPARVRFLSCEPLLGPVEFRGIPVPIMRGAPGIDWVICGGESGPVARPMHPDWARSLRDQCAAAGVPFFFKQWGEWAPASEEYGISGSVMPESGVMPCGKEATWIGWDGKTSCPSFHGLKEPIMAIAKVGKKAAGRMLDGRTHDDVPTQGGSNV